MPSVTGITAARADEIEDKILSHARIDTVGHLILVLRDGTEKDAGKVVPSGLIAYPVGAVYTSTSSTSPSIHFGGTWVAGSPATSTIDGIGTVYNWRRSA